MFQFQCPSHKGFRVASLCLESAFPISHHIQLPVTEFYCSKMGAVAPLLQPKVLDDCCLLLQDPVSSVCCVFLLDCETLPFQILTYCWWCPCGSSIVAWTLKVRVCFLKVGHWCYLYYNQMESCNYSSTEEPVQYLPHCYQ